MPNTTVALDIDEAIANGLPNAANLEADYQLVSRFQKNGLYIEAILPHIIHPGVIEHIRLLDKHGIRIVFYSSGDPVRNKLLVEQLLCLALGNARYEELKDHLIILSGQRTTSEGEIVTDLVADEGRRELQYKQYEGRFGGTWKKDLTKLVTKDFELEWTVLLDNDLSFVLHKQEKNLLKVCTATPYDFAMVYKRSGKRSWDPEDARVLNAYHMLYATGLLFTAIARAKEQRLTLTEVLHQIQFKITIKDGQTQYIYDQELCKNKAFYEYGLQLIRSVNPDFNCLDCSMFEKEPVYGRASEQKLCLDGVPETGIIKQGLSKESLMLACDIDSINSVSEMKDGSFKITFDDQADGLKVKKLEADLKSKGISCNAQMNNKTTFIQTPPWIAVEKKSMQAFTLWVKEGCQVRIQGFLNPGLQWGGGVEAMD
jgi:hypothetical protein